ncbi:glycosyltransferase family 2 protein [Desulfopila sp. IMCC35006]|uniref:glycosyltransferase family 2 protein n=1 Tax=Desulfopila sp. IMCC35006 TaxID=2569542 RepID=UPI0010AD8794|nr:glycosyltransferase family 2 protein [Desulfopila sp. IMCC35006]TKB24944.1 glycosyltransferase family 2 protein [Desulfopila sp. IMCC35006]
MLLITCKLCFFFSLFMIFYVYAGYPICVWLLTRLVRKSIDKGPYEPSVTILIAAYNEDKHIGQTITNKLQLDYPEKKLELIVISDESTDQTDSIIQSFNNKNVKFIRQSPRAGKTAALNLAISQAAGEILVFSDANSIYDSNALKHIVANFHDPKVGYVTGKMIYTNTDGSPIGDGCSAYMRYENFLRSMESQIGSIVGVDGGIDAVRKSIHSKLNPDQLPDFVQPLKVTEQGFRVVYEPEALLKESSLSKSDEEYKMRVRVSLRAIWALKDMNELLWGRAGFLFAWQLWSHKLLRYFCFVFLLGAYVSNAFLWSEMIWYKSFFVVQTACYVGAFVSALLERANRQIEFLYFLHYFLLLNIAAAHAFLKFISGKKQVIWQPRKG